MSLRSLASPDENAGLQLLRLERRLERERKARIEAELIAERGLRELYEKRRQLELLETVATAANESKSVTDTLRFAVSEVCKFSEWALGHVQMLETRDGASRLVPTTIWHAEHLAGFAEFVTASTAMTFTAGHGLPGRVLATGAPTWIPDLAADDNFPRHEVALASGLRSALAFPIRVGPDVVAVLEFFSLGAIDPDPALLALMSQIGTQLGRVIERKRAEDRLVHDASHDALTKLPNRVLFLDRLGRAIARAKRSPRYAFAVLFIDLDRFKLVNDSLGHAAGDELLKEIGRRLRDALALEDSAATARDVDSAHTLARLGGDEFTVLLDDVQPAAAIQIAERLQAALKAPITIERQDVYTSASIGVATGSPDCVSADDILRDADLAMYRAKADGRARVGIYDQGMHELAVERLRLESDLRRALREDEFVLHYQPIVALDVQEVVGFEALIRWQHPDGGLRSPADFIDVAEETGLIVFVGNWVLQEACRTIARLQHDFPRAKPLTVSINISPRQFTQPDLVDQVRQAVQEAGIAPASVRLEITESVTIHDADGAIAILNQLRAFGVRVAIDDFGIGYSSLNYLHRLPLDALKIDKAFVAAMSHNGDGHDIVRTILDLAKNLGLDVIAEGTELEHHIDQLHLMGCGFAQGYYFSRPLDLAATRTLLEGVASSNA